jgi:hypothetical protein
MTLTLTGAVILLLSAIMFFRSSFGLLLLLIISIPFSATAVFNFKQGNAGTGISFTLVILVIYLFKRSLQTLLNSHFYLLGKFSLQLLFIFICILALSLSIPLFNSGVSFIATDPKGALTSNFILLFSSDHIIQWGYFLIWGLFLLLVGKDLYTIDQLFIVLRTSLYTGIFVSLWGWGQIFMSILHIPYPFQIFNNTASSSGQGYKQIIESVGISRMSSVSVEPSIFAVYLLLLLSLLLGFIIIRTPILGLRIDLWLAGFLTLTLLASTATTGYLGLIFLVFISFIALFKVKKNLLTRIVYLSIGFSVFLLILYLIYLNVPFFNNVINRFLFTRSESFSFSQRSISIRYAIDSFLRFPILGLGVSTMTVYSLPFWLLANSGLVGLFSFVTFYISLFKYPTAVLKTSITLPKIKGLGLGIILSLYLLFFITTLTGFPYIYGYFWLPIMLSLSISRFMHIQKTSRLLLGQH